MNCSFKKFMTAMTCNKVMTIYHGNIFYALVSKAKKVHKHERKMLEIWYLRVLVVSSVMLLTSPARFF